ncbi:GYDIA family GHMP kinase [Chryseobacterium sp. MFBS3-17]|uniref:GYDIA family GHMP kinase n=1 Tax=Chryseobacterium sp. MFBS3-17 TaxID=2886689 RepID=UPI001D0E119C|nr:GYDIA family GHMP kinase [Chryseobacterium sp. MFBS3-17]MCC2589448.1 hypothetical protein [Chryseobacterium sp. MFBS3-17]
MGSIFSPGKLLLTSEYFVLDGALALAVPTIPGQEFFFEESADGCSRVNWEAYHMGKLWLKAVLRYDDWQILETNLPAAADFVLKVLQSIQEMAPDKFTGKISYDFSTNLQFPADFGLGSSSTLMNNLAQWAAIDPYVLNEKCLGGSGYDIAVAAEQSAILYKTQPERSIEKVQFEPPFADDLLLVHLNQKQNSREGISLYRSREKLAVLIDEFSELTTKIYHSRNIEHFSDNMIQHERMVSDFIGIPTVKERLFTDYDGFIKSLGAWGGDFVLAAKNEMSHDYFKDRGFNRVYRWKDLVSSSEKNPD